MADLTAPVDAEKPELFIPHGPKEPIDRSGGLFEGVLNAVDTGVKMFGMSQKDAGVNDAAVQTSQAIGEANNSLTPLPPEVSASIGTLQKVGKAQDQGSMPPGSVDMHLQNIQSSLFAKYPGQAGQIAEYFHRNGYDSLMYQNLYTQQKQQEAMASAKTDEMTENFKTGSVYRQPDWTDEQTIQFGAQARLNQANTAAAKAQMEAAAAKTTANKDDYDLKKTQASDALRTSLMSQAVLHSNPILSTFHNMVDANPEALSQHPEYLTQAINFFEAQRDQLHTQGIGLTATDLKSVDDQITQTEKGFQDFYTNYSSEKGRVLKNLQTTMGVQGIEAFPTYSYMKGVLGENVLNQVFGGMGPTLPKPMLDEIKTEMAGFTGSNTAGGRVALNLVGEMLQGKLQLKDVPQENVKNVVAGAIVGVSAHTADINAGNLKDPTTVTQFAASLGTLADAAFTIQPVGNPDIKTILTASNTLSDPRVIAAARTLTNNPSTADRAQGLMGNIINANQHLLMAAKNANISTSTSFVGSPGAPTFGSAGNEFSIGRSAQAPYKTSLDWDDKVGYWKVSSSGQVPGYLTEPLFTQAKAMNRAVDALVSTTPDNKEFPQGATPLSLRQFYSGHITTDKLTNAQGKFIVQPSQNISMEDTINKATENLRRNTTQIELETANMSKQVSEVTKPLEKTYDPQSPQSQATENIIVTAAPKYAATAKMNPEDFTALAKAVAVAESSMGANIKSGTDVHGPMQVTQKTGDGYINGFNRDDPTQDIEAGTHYLADLVAKFGGNLTRALHEYNGGGDPNYAAKVLNYYYQFKGQT